MRVVTASLPLIRLCYNLGTQKEAAMSRIKIEDLPVLEDMTPKEARGIFGGVITMTAKSDVAQDQQLSTLATAVRINVQAFNVIDDFRSPVQTSDRKAEST